jgi:mono/diheme cytochrome c family protein
MHSTRPLYTLSAFLTATAGALTVIAIALSPSLGTAQQPTKVKTTPIIQSDPSSGKQMYADYCAPCHGQDGKGNGPAATAMKTPPANLSLLAKNNGGKYPEAHVAAVLNFGDEKSAHGNKQMPVWGPLFESLDWTSSAKGTEAKQRINRLNSYIETLQAK